MKERDNVGVLDSAIRSMVACVLLALAVEQIFPTAVNLIFVAVGAALWVSVSVGVCPLYKLLGVDTYHKVAH
ncbi:hypothetical protein HMF8227_00387 [Saliniradius amylolyticus]|uniref:Inner membrane protein YgaP-like transmembrane domain-containing protein n=1 Tax=Saliniradius amylolyticus TaxID=2183582 RepID=A0A2S2DZV5_9ALTE|nr:DUF2892 domain-containing protein [Saliniradius amylolyticus]AWL10893.1 hypothetical protein HMF8227_00387 [Saliniradius amylolyticus]